MVHYIQQEEDLPLQRRVQRSCLFTASRKTGHNPTDTGGGATEGSLPRLINVVVGLVRRLSAAPATTRALDRLVKSLCLIAAAGSSGRARDRNEPARGPLASATPPTAVSSCRARDDAGA